MDSWVKQKFERAGLWNTPPDESSAIDLDQVFAVVRRQWRTAVVCAVVALCLGIAYLVTAVPVYSSYASILIDSSNQKIVDQLSPATGQVQDDASVLSQVELLRSDRIAQSVSEKLDLKNDPVFMADRQGPLQSLISLVRGVLDVSGWFSSDKAETSESAEEIQRDILLTLEDHLWVSRVTDTYVLTVGYSSVDPDLSARITQAYAESYLTDQLDSKYEATRRASEWLQKRIAELRDRALQTDLAVQKFRAEKGLIASDGQLLSEQQLTQMNSQLILARSDTASAQAKYDRIQQILKSGDMSGAVSESLSSEVINDLRSKYLETSRKQADIASRLGEKHVQAIRLLNQMSEYKRLMFDELGRIAQTYKNNYEISLARQKSLETQVTQATDVSATANDSQVQLRELEREADTYKKLYETFLQRYQEAVQQQSFPITEARIISNAVPNYKPSSPKKPAIVVLSIFLGLMVGAAFGLLREFRDRDFRTGDQIRSTLMMDSLGIVPLIKSSPITSSGKRGGGGPAQSRVIAKQDSISNYVIDHPLSSFAETMRSTKIGVDVSIGAKRPKMVGVISTLPGEGKSTISINFAELLVSEGARVLLIDADLRNPGLTRQIGRHAEQGIIEALEDSAAIRGILMVNPETRLAFLPAVIKRRVPYSAELLASEGMEHVLSEIADAFDYVIFDLPPLGAVVDGRAIAERLDAFIYVAEWGKTPRSLVRKTLVANAPVAQKCVGIVLSKVDTTKMKLYEDFGSAGFYYDNYSTYYRH